jgi:hypothetical protein
MNPEWKLTCQVVTEIADIFEGYLDSAALVIWFLGDNGWLDDNSPFNMLAIYPDHVIQAARDEVTGMNPELR